MTSAILPYSTQVVTRVALNDVSKTARKVLHWNLPADTLLYVPITAQNPRDVSSGFKRCPPRMSLLV